MKELRNFFYEEDGLETIEIAIILAALVALAIVFKKQLAQLWNSAAKDIKKVGEKAGIGDIENDGSIGDFKLNGNT